MDLFIPWYDYITTQKNIYKIQIDESWKRNNYAFWPSPMTATRGRSCSRKRKSFSIRGLAFAESQFPFVLFPVRKVTFHVYAIEDVIFLVPYRKISNLASQWPCRAISLIRASLFITYQWIFRCFYTICILHNPKNIIYVNNTLTKDWKSNVYIFDIIL